MTHQGHAPNVIIILAHMASKHEHDAHPRHSALPLLVQFHYITFVFIHDCINMIIYDCKREQLLTALILPFAHSGGRMVAYFMGA